MTEEDIKNEFKKHKITFISEFVNIFLPAPASNKKYKYFAVKSIEGKEITVWGASNKELLEQFRQFVSLKIFI